MSNHLVQEIKKILSAIDKELELHDGGAQFISFKDSVLYISFSGACVVCSDFSCSLMANIEYKLKKAVPEIERVVVI